MSTSEDHTDEEYGTARLNHRGRLTIPKELRDDLNLEDGTEFRVVRDGGNIRLVRELPELETLTRDEEWGEEAFRDAGDATFGGR
ncbi:AbrB/MazE/SpoVT family DNA-binding domain-containing protein [Natronobacterium texcoconense]|uniref:Looped-hinge helix DNA binding domain-containing protein, AbrB family n=1 Tax=Natronobacterium texcoconense TaxID=1095778 RepID=A0A1H1I3G7_NATTX|nr:AbrB/MazE/SpoVT family DNA-binding domain-containing protein [Natronobacterium texcoconense]SDR31886.1 looped-hinge helix DNA binding domain-containing protein, AbrB family [Natronobacterium texcoconense]